MSDISIITRLLSLAVGEFTNITNMRTVENVDFRYDPTPKPVCPGWSPVAVEIAASGHSASLLFMRVRQAIRHANEVERNCATAEQKTHYLVRSYTMATRTECRFITAGMRVESTVCVKYIGSATLPVSMPVPETFTVSE